MRRLLKQVDVKQLYNPVLQEVRVSWRSEFGVSCCSLRCESQVPAEAAPSEPPVEQPGERERSAVIAIGAGGQYVAVFVQSPSHLSHITLSQPFRIK